MAKCAYCNSRILFGGTQKGGRMFCGDSCVEEGKLAKAADGLPQHVVDATVLETHQGLCPECDGEGPVDIHMSHELWSTLLYVGWSNTPNKCCLSCGRNQQWKGLVKSWYGGWLGGIWGWIYTPIQACRNIGALMTCPNPEFPSEQLEAIVRFELAGQVVAGEPLPDYGRRSARSMSAIAEPIDDRVTGECERCGKKFKAKSSMAGKAAKCRGCGSKVRIPDVEDEDSPEDEWGDDDNWYQKQDESIPSRRGTGRTSKKGPQPKKKWNVWRVIGVGTLCFMGLIFVGFASVIALAVTLKMFNLGNEAPRPVGQQVPALREMPQRPEIPNRPNSPPAEFGSNSPQNPVVPKYEVPKPSFQPPPKSASASQSPKTLPAQPDNVASNPFQPVAEMPDVQSLSNIDRAGGVWFVLSNLRPGQNAGPSPINKPFLIDYQLASGTPAPNDRCVLHLSVTRGGTFRQYADVAVQLEDSGTIEFKVPSSFGRAEIFTASIALPAGHQQWQNISEEITPGGRATAAVPPPSVMELAGPDAQGRQLAIANASFGSGNGPFPTLKLKFVLQQEISPGSYCFLIATTPSGQTTEFDLSRALRQATVNVETEFSGRAIGATGALRPPFTLHVVNRDSRVPSRFRSEPAKVVSNSISISD